MPSSARRCPHAPWYVVPGDRKWVRNLTVARILRHTLERLDPQYPEPEPGIEGLVVDLSRARGRFVQFVKCPW